MPSLLLLSCGKEPQPAVIEQGWAQRLSSKEHTLSVPYLDDWVIIEENYREGILSLRSEKEEDENHVSLVVTILPVVMTKRELNSETRRILELSLYNLLSIEETIEKEYEDLIVQLTDASAGDLEPVKARSAGFSKGGRTYLFTVLTGEDSFDYALEELDNILSSIKD